MQYEFLLESGLKKLLIFLQKKTDVMQFHVHSQIIYEKCINLILPQVDRLIKIKKIYYQILVVLLLLLYRRN